MIAQLLSLSFDGRWRYMGHLESHIPIIILIMILIIIRYDPWYSIISLWHGYLRWYIFRQPPPYYSFPCFPFKRWSEFLHGEPPLRCSRRGMSWLRRPAEQRSACAAAAAGPLRAAAAGGDGGGQARRVGPLEPAEVVDLEKYLKLGGSPTKMPRRWGDIRSCKKKQRWSKTSCETGGLKGQGERMTESTQFPHQSWDDAMGSHPVAVTWITIITIIITKTMLKMLKFISQIHIRINEGQDHHQHRHHQSSFIIHHS